MLNYVEPLFRPPSEWKSLILQVTNGCSHNTCSFCDMYTQPQKRFRAKKLENIEADLQKVAASGAHVSRVFLADGDAMTLPYARLQAICELIHRYLPDVQRISSYCLPRNLNNKTVEQLAELNRLKLNLMYVGCESGDDEVLRCVDKGETFASSLQALNKIKAAGMKSSVMILNGLGGPALSYQHAKQSAALMNQAQPEYLSTLVVSFPLGDERHAQGFDGRFQQLNQTELFQEMVWLLEDLQLENTTFRSDHASNYLVLKGTLGKDKQRILAQVQQALTQPGSVPLRQEWQRGL